MVLTRAYIAGLLLILLLAAVPAGAAEPDPFGGRLLPIELVMAFRRQIDLTAEQNKRLGAMVVELQQNVAGKQWEMQSAFADLLELLDQNPVDEPRALDLAKRAIDIENTIKVEQIRMLIRVRNMLTDAQVEFLRGRLAAGWKKEKE
jgi:Spy/CpxP family protein refolding chaperone